MTKEEKNCTISINKRKLIRTTDRSLTIYLVLPRATNSDKAYVATALYILTRSRPFSFRIPPLPAFFSFDFHRIASVFHRSTTTVPSVFPQIFFILWSTAFISATDIGKTTRSNRDYIDRKRKKKKKEETPTQNPDRNAYI